MTHSHTLRTIAAILLLLLMHSTGSQAQQNLFDELVEPYFEAFELNEQQQYLEAHGAMQAVSRQADSLLTATGKTVSDISSGEFMSFYWPVKKSVAEIAYMLGLQTEMRNVAAQLVSCLQIRNSTSNDAEAVTEGYRADLAKILGGYYYLANSPDSAEQVLATALMLKPHDRPFQRAVRGDMAQLYYSQQQYPEALQQLDSILALFGRDNTAETQRQEVMSQRAICLARMGQLDEALSIINNVVAYCRQQADNRRLAEALRKKGKILVLRHDANGGSLAEAASCYEEYLSLARAFVDENFCGMSASDREQYWMAERSFVTDCYRLESQSPTLLYDVALFSKAVLLQLGRTFQPGMNAQQRSQALQAVRVGWQQVQQNLGQGDAAVEFVNYEKQGQEWLGALVLTRNAAPTFVAINPVSTITSHAAPLNNQATITVADLFTLRGGAFGDDAKISAIYNDPTLPSLLWPESLTSILSASNTIYMAVDGILHRLAPEYLLPEALAGKQVIRLTSTRQLTDARSSLRTDRMLMCGGVDYEQGLGNATANNDDLAYSIISSNFHGHLSYLPCAARTMATSCCMPTLSASHLCASCSDSIRLCSYLPTDHLNRPPHWALTCSLPMPTCNCHRAASTLQEPMPTCTTPVSMPHRTTASSLPARWLRSTSQTLTWPSSLPASRVWDSLPPTACSDCSVDSRRQE